MRQLLFSAVIMLVLGGVGEAGENQLAQPYSPPQQVITPPTIIFPGNPTSRAQLEEELETLEAHRDTKKAFVKAAEVGVRAAELNLQRMQTVVSRGAASKEEVDRATIDVEAAKAQLEIRMAEMKEVEVKIKYAKKRLEDAKSGPKHLHPQPAPTPPKLVEPPKIGVPPKPIDPPKLADPPKLPDPPKLEAPPKPADPKKPLLEDYVELKVKITLLESDVAREKTRTELAHERLNTCEKELLERKELFANPNTPVIKNAESKLKEAAQAEEKAKAEWVRIYKDLEVLKAKLKEIETR